jgi:hypothetical protein
MRIIIKVGLLQTKNVITMIYMYVYIRCIRKILIRCFSCLVKDHLLLFECEFLPMKSALKHNKWSLTKQLKHLIKIFLMHRIYTYIYIIVITFLVCRRPTLIIIRIYHPNSYNNFKTSKTIWWQEKNWYL